MSRIVGLPIRLRADTAMIRLSEFTIGEDCRHSHWGLIDINTGLAARAYQADSQEKMEEKIDDIVSHEGLYLLAFLLRGRESLLSKWERGREEGIAGKWGDFLGRCAQPHVIVLDIGATHLRVRVLGPHGLLLHKPARTLTPNKQLYPQDTLTRLQERLIKALIREINIARARHINLSLEEIRILFSAVVTREGIVQDTSILWNSSARGYDFKNALLERLYSVRLTILNDVSSASSR